MVIEEIDGPVGTSPVYYQETVNGKTHTVVVSGTAPEIQVTVDGDLTTMAHGIAVIPSSELPFAKKHVILIQLDVARILTHHRVSWPGAANVVHTVMRELGSDLSIPRATLQPILVAGADAQALLSG